MAKHSSHMTEGPCDNPAADLRPKKATELRRPDSGFFSAGTTPVIPIEELNTPVQNSDEGWKMTVKAIPSHVSWREQLGSAIHIYRQIVRVTVKLRSGQVNK